MNIVDKKNLVIENTQRAYNVGYTNGANSSNDASTFWDAYQDFGERKNYNYAFYGDWWQKLFFENNFMPKYDITPEDGNDMFAYWSNVYGTFPLQVVEEFGLSIDLTKLISAQRMFNVNLTFHSLPAIKISYSADYMFSGCSSLATIESFEIESNCNINYCFFGCFALENITFLGTISVNGLDLKDSKKLSYDSLVSLINALEDKSTDTSGKVWKVTIGSTNLAKLTDDDLDIIQLKGWQFV